MPPQPLTARRGGPLTGRIRVPGDKSISHRALILGAMTVGETTITGLLEGEDVLDTADAMRALGAQVERGERRANWRVRGVGVGGFADPRGAARFRQFRHRLPAGARRGRRLADHGDVRRRRFAALAADEARARSAGENGRAGDARRRMAAGCRSPCRAPPSSIRSITSRRCLRRSSSRRCCSPDLPRPARPR